MRTSKPLRQCSIENYLAKISHFIAGNTPVLHQNVETLTLQAYVVIVRYAILQASIAFLVLEVVPTDALQTVLRQIVKATVFDDIADSD